MILAAVARCSTTPGPHRGRDTRRAARQHLPLHRLHKVIDAIMQAKKMINGGKTGVEGAQGGKRPYVPVDVAACGGSAREQQGGKVTWLKSFTPSGRARSARTPLLKVTGQAEYTTDIHPRGMVYGKILGSPIPHGIIKSIDTSEAEKLPGVVCVVTGEDGPDHPTIGGYLTDRYIMNRVGQKVRYVGDFVAAVAATDEQIAEAACKLIKVEYEPLPYVLDVEEAFREDCPAVVHEDVQSYKRLDLHGVAHCMDKKHPNQAIRRKVRHSESFDLDPDSFETPEAYDEAFEKKFNEEFDKAYLSCPPSAMSSRVSHCFMEPTSAWSSRWWTAHRALVQ
ncbi:MAG: hypothetical protein ACLUEK_00375 [Oscillospiraceae bacterium]